VMFTRSILRVASSHRLMSKVVVPQFTRRQVIDFHYVVFKHLFI
jgi:hypothetical protein